MIQQIQDIKISQLKSDIEQNWNSIEDIENMSQEELFRLVDSYGDNNGLLSI